MSVEQSPGGQAMKVMQESNMQIVFKKPVGFMKKKTRQKVLSEESYVEDMGKIIERDFFPDLEKLRVQNDYLEAMEKNDYIKIRELHAKYSGQKTPQERIPSPATFETPANIHGTAPVQEQTFIAPKPPEEKKLSLDQYLNSHTSEDNQSFEEMMEEADKKHKQKFSYLYNEETKSLQYQAELLQVPSIEQQALEPVKKLDIDTWGYKNRNYIMYVPDGVPLTEEEELEINSKRQEISHGNTRLSLNPFNEVQSKETITELAKMQSKVLDGKIGVDGKELITGTPKINGFSFVRTPSPCPGVAESPLMTWGAVEGTPFRLDGGDTPIPRGTHGPSFKMNEPPKREQIAIALAEKASERHRDKKRKAMDAARRQFASPSPRRPSSSRIERLSSMSPAAQRLAGLKKIVGSERGLLTPSPRVRTPSLKGQMTPKLNLGIRKNEDNLTDDLLKINVPKRQSASEFF